ncbi:MAG: F0F1 ATP synthase subunit gamma [Clostridia bacterium]|nr:F0F1 ATP synthase subunit gamma [Clostridia bacterium]
MPAVQILKKKLRGIRSTQKVAKAMKTVSTVKFSKLNGIFNEFSAYGRQCASLYWAYKEELISFFPPGDPEAPVCVVVLCSNKGLCGSFNAEVLNFAQEELEKLERPYLLVACGKQAINYFKEKQKPIEKELIFGDVPSYEDGRKLLNLLTGWRAEKKISSIKVIYPHYVNMVKQQPSVENLFEITEDTKEESGEAILFVPDRPTIIEKTANNIFQSLMYEVLLETALGAQAATLMTMRSAYDTATEYSQQLESQINRQRQSAVTADVIETSSERKE